MKEANTKNLEYPFNLLWAVTEDEEIIENADMITDLCGSVEYVLYTLTERERNVIKCRFVDAMTFENTARIFGVTKERIRQVEAKALRKLRHPSRLKYLTKGLFGIVEEIKTDYYRKFADLEAKLIELCKVNEKSADTIIEEHNLLKRKYKADDIKSVNFSVRTLNCLRRANITTISELATLTYDEITRIRNLGRKSIQEIINKLCEYGYEVNYTAYGRKE